MTLPSFVVPKCGSLLPTYDKLDNDPRGICWIFEPPSSTATYSMGIDPTVGRVGWCRESRVDEDKLTDNTVIEIVKVGQPDVQVCEYAGPVDFMQTARMANLLGRAYKGREEDGCLCIGELPGPGVQILQTMLNQFHYSNMWIWKHLDTALPKLTKSFWFYASRANNQHLWISTSRHIKVGNLIINSPWLVDEMMDSTINPLKGYAEAITGCHDDRLKAISLAIYGAHEWSTSVDFSEQVDVQTAKKPDWCTTDFSLEEVLEEWNERFLEIME
jgi:hypothetical protein